VKRSGQKSAAQTPAPIKDRVYGSTKNPKESAKSKSSGKSINFTDKIITGLKNKVEDYNEKHPKDKVSISTLKAVYRRGSGAYSSSHRPTITGGVPNSRSAWSFARVNKFLQKKAGNKVKKAYVQDDDLMEKGGDLGQEITCVNCGWNWNTNQSDISDKYVCHKCGFDNRTFYDSDPIGKYDGANTTGDIKNPDIRYFKGGKLEGFSELQKSIYSEIWSSKKTYIFRFPSDSTLILIRNSQEKIDEFQKDADKEFLKKIISEKYGNSIADSVISDIESGKLESFKITKDTDLEDYQNIMVIDNTTVSLLVEGKSFKKNKKLAPNGKPSNLSDKQYELVRTPQFKAWFGDWENDPENASKVVDENGEPLVVFRGDNSSSKKGNVFKTGFNRLGFVGKDRLANQYFFYFVDKYHVANGYADDQVDEHNADIKYYGKKGKFWFPKVTEYFLNIRKPIDFTPNNPLFTTYEEYYKRSLYFNNNKLTYDEKNLMIPSRYGYELFLKDFHNILTKELGDYLVIDGQEDNRWETSRIEGLLRYIGNNSNELEATWRYFAEYEWQRDRSEILRRLYLKMKNLKFDGIVFLEQSHYEDVELDDWQFGNAEKKKLKYDHNDWKHKPKVFAALESNQIKLANGSNMKFDSENPDIRYAEGGNLPVGKLAKGMSLSEVAAIHGLQADDLKSELKIGVKKEMEHTDHPEYARAIALDHLYEDPKYYTKYKKMEGIDSHFESIRKEYAEGGTIDAVCSFKTPTCEPSKLSYLQQVLVRTKSFKDFFGDWEMAAKRFISSGRKDFEVHYKEVSKIIDYVTLEPKVLYHGTRTESEFFRFDVTKEKGVGRPYGYFAFNKEYSENFTTSSQRGHSSAKPFLYEVFLNVRNPFKALGQQYVAKNRLGADWMNIIIGTILWDKYKSVETNNENRSFVDAITSQIYDYVSDTFYDSNNNPERAPFWRLMARDAQKDFKYFLMAYNYDGIEYTEEFSSSFDIDNPAEFTQAVTIFDSKQVKLADGRNLNFNPLIDDIRYEDGGQVQDDGIIDQDFEMKSTMDKKAKLGALLSAKKYAEGGKVVAEESVNPNDGKRGGYFKGRSHADGGIKAVNKDTGQLIEVEGEEVIITKGAVKDTKKREFEGKMLTNREILSRINQSGGGVSFEDGGEIHGSSCGCRGKKYMYGGKLVDDYSIVKMMNEPFNIAEQNILKARSFVDDLVEKMK